MSVSISQLAPLGFLGLFQLIGGVAAGSGLRKLLVEHALGSSFLVIWGFGFGGIPMLIGAALGASTRLPLLALVGPAVFLSALAFGLLLLPWLVQVLGAATLGTLLVGTLFTLGGSAVALAIVRSGKGATAIGLMVAVIFVLIGIWLCWTALSPLFRGQTLDSAGTVTARHGS